MQVIQRLIVGFNPPRIFEVGTEYEGQVIIKIASAGTEFEQSVHSEYHIEDEHGRLIAHIENAPVIVEYRQIAVHDAEEVG
jgi:hypothetical protein